MRILFWSELFWPYSGGAEIFATKLLFGLRKLGHDFIVVTRQDDLHLPEEESFEEFPIYRFPFYSALKEGNVNKLMKIRQQVMHLKCRYTPDLIHVNCFGISLLFHLDTEKEYSAPLLVTLHGERYKPVIEQNTLLERILRNASWVTGPSKRTVEYAQTLIPGFVPPTSHIYNGLEVPSFLPDPLPMEAPRLLCLGRLVSSKGFDLVLSALPEIIQNFPNVRLIIAGDGEARNELEKQRTNLGLNDVVDFIGWVAHEKVPALINTATVVVVPSRVMEALPFVALEAGIMARPVVAARVGGLSEIVVHQETGLLVEKEDSAALGQALSFLLEHPTKAVQIGQSARRRVMDLFSLKHCIQSYDVLYRRLCKGVYK
jgi:glycogen(starch) synthase